METLCYSLLLCRSEQHFLFLLTQEFHSSHMKRMKFYIFIGSPNPFSSFSRFSMTFDLESINKVVIPQDWLLAFRFVTLFSILLSPDRFHSTGLCQTLWHLMMNNRYLNYPFYCRGQCLSNKNLGDYLHDSFSLRVEDDVGICMSEQKKLN